MTSHPSEELLLHLNNRLEAHAVVELLGYHASRASRVGGIIKCHCPVHLGETYRTLSIDVDARTCVCFVRDCALNRSGTLVDLVAHSRGILPEEAALFLARKFSFSISPESVSILADSLFRDAEHRFSRKEREEAYRRVKAAVTLNPRDDAQVMRAAGILRSHGMASQALQLVLALARRVRLRTPSQAIYYLEEGALPFEPDDPAVLAELAECCHAADPDDSRWATILWDRARILREKDLSEEALADFRRAIAMLADDASRQEEFGRALLDFGNRSDALNALWAAAVLHENRGNDQAAAAILEEIAKLDPADEKCRDRLFALQQRLGNWEGYLIGLEKSGREALDRGNLEEARGCFEALVKRQPDDIDTVKVLAQIAHGLGQMDEWAAHTVKVARLLGKAERTGEAREALLPLTSGNIAVDFLVQAGEELERLDTPEQAALCFFHAAKAMAETEPVEATHLLHRAVPYLHQDRGRMEAAAKLFVALQCPEDAGDCFVNAAQSALAAGDAEATLAIVQAAFDEPGALEVPELHGLRAQALHRLERTTEAVDALFGQIRLLLLKDRTEEARESVLIAESWLSGTWVEMMGLLLIITGANGQSLARERAEAFLQQALVDDRRDDLRESCEFLVSIAPEEPRFHRIRARVALEDGDTARAVAVFREAARRALEQDDPKLALEIVNEAAEALPDNDGLIPIRVSALLAADKRKEAEALAESAIQELHKAERWNEAAALCLSLAGFGPRYFPWREKLAEYYLLQGDKDGALSELKKFVKETIRKKPERALHAQRRVFELLPDSANEAERLANLQERAEGTESARPLFCQAFDLYNAQYSNLSDLERKLRQFLRGREPFPELITRFSEILRQRGDSERAREVLAEAIDGLQKTGSPELRIPVLRMHVEWCPQDAGARFSLARDLESTGAPEEAASEALRAAEQFAATAEWDKAEEALRFATRIQPDNAAGQFRIGEVFARQDRSGDASEAFRKAAALYAGEQNHAGQKEAALRLLDIDSGDIEARRVLVRVMEQLEGAEAAAPERLRLVRALAKSGEAKEALEELGKIGAGKTLSREVLTLAGEIRAAHPDAGAILHLFERHRRFVETDAQLLRMAAEAAEQDDPAAAPRWWTGCSFRAEEKDDIPLALAAGRRAAAIDPPQADAIQRLAVLLDRYDHGMVSERIDVHRKAAALLEKSSPDQAAIHCRSILDLLPSSVDTMIMLAQLEERQGHRKTVGDILERAAAAARELGDISKLRRVLEWRLEYVPTDTAALEEVLDLAQQEGDWKSETAWAAKLADTAEAKGDFETAIALYKKTASADPQDTASRHRLFELYLAAGEPESAAAHLREVVEIHLASDNLALAIETLRRVESIDHDNPDTLEQIGHLYRRIHDNEQAIDYLLSAAREFHRRGSPERALDITDEIFALQPGNPKALRFLRAEVLAALDRNTAAREELEEAATYLEKEEAWDDLLATLERSLLLDPDSLAVRERLANLLNDLDRPEEAAAQFLLLSGAHERQEQPEQALEAARMALRLAPDYYDAHAHMAVLSLRHAQQEDASRETIWLADFHEKNMEYEAALLQLRRSPSYNHSSYLMMRAAKLKKAIGENEEAQTLLTKVADEAAKNGDASMEAQALSLILEINPQDIEILRRLIACLKEQDDTEGAIEAVIAAFQRLLVQGEIERAREVAPLAIELAAAPDELHARLADSYREQGVPELAAIELTEAAGYLMEQERHTDALAAVDRALESFPLHSPAMEKRLALLQRLDRFAEARQYAAEVIEHYRNSQELDRAIRICRELVDLHPDGTQPRRTLTELLTVSQQQDALVEELRQLADLHLQNEQLDEAVKVLRELLSIRPDDTRARIYYIDAFRQIGNEDELVDDYLKLAENHALNGSIHEATVAYEKALELAPQDPRVHGALVSFLLANGQATRAVSQAMEHAGVLEKLGRTREAFEALEKVVEHGREEPAYLRHLSKVLLATNARGRAAKELRHALEIYRKQENFDEEVATLRELAEIDPYATAPRSELIAMLLTGDRRQEAIEEICRLAATFEERGLADMAAAEYRRALELDPANTGVWRRLLDTHNRMGSTRDLARECVAFAEMLIGKGRTKEAVDFFRRAIEADPRNISIRRTLVDRYPKAGLRDIAGDIVELARMLAKERMIEDALRYLEALLTADPHNTQVRGLIDSMEPSERSASGSPGSGIQTRDFRPASRPDSKAVPPPRQTNTPVNFLLGELNNIDEEEVREALRQVEQNYREILKVNVNNATVRLKLAEALEQMGDHEEALKEIGRAAEIYIKKNDFAACVKACERYLALRPNDATILRRLNEAVLRQDAMKALESTILFSEKKDGADGD